MAERKYTHGLSTRQQHGSTVVDIGDMEIWDGADLSLLRDTLTSLIHRDRCRAVGIDMRTVKFVPSGFFGMLFDWFEQGIVVRLISPQPRVQNMLWFRRFFVMERNGDSFRLRDSAPIMERDEMDWVQTRDWPSSQDSDPGLAIASLI